jgi:glycosyltransferase involved in cell wall biosynthesis
VRIGVDATSWLNRRGFGRFTRNAVTRMVALDQESTYVLLLDEASAEATDLPAAAERLVVSLGRPASAAASADSNRGVRDLLRLARAARAARLDAFLFPSMLTYFPVPGVPTVVGVHDTIADDLPELTFPRRRGRLLWALKQRLAMRTATRLFTVSEAARAAITRRSGVPSERLPIVSEAPDPAFSVQDPVEIRLVLTRLGLEVGNPFLLYAGGISPHKNIETLLEAYARVIADRAPVPPLVLVGDLERESYLSAADSVRRRIDELRIGPHVILPGFVSDRELACLYSAATAVALPSLAEGFGLPAVEAARCGAPVVLSDLPAHRESLGNGGLYFAPRDTAALAAALNSMLDDPSARNALAAQGSAAVAGLTWDAAARSLHGLLLEAARA